MGRNVDSAWVHRCRCAPIWNRRHRFNRCRPCVSILASTHAETAVAQQNVEANVHATANLKLNETVRASLMCRAGYTRPQPQLRLATGVVAESSVRGRFLRCLSRSVAGRGSSALMPDADAAKKKPSARMCGEDKWCRSRHGHRSAGSSRRSSSSCRHSSRAACRRSVSVGTPINRSTTRRRYAIVHAGSGCAASVGGDAHDREEAAIDSKGCGGVCRRAAGDGPDAARLAHARRHHCCASWLGI